MMSPNIAKRKSKGKEHQRLTTPRECKDQGKVQINCFQDSPWFMNIVERKYKSIYDKSIIQSIYDKSIIHLLSQISFCFN